MCVYLQCENIELISFFEFIQIKFLCLLILKLLRKKTKNVDVIIISVFWEVNFIQYQKK